MKLFQFVQFQIFPFAFFIFCVFPTFLFTFEKTKNDFEKIRKGVVQIKVYSQETNFYTPWVSQRIRSGSGTGFIIENNQILTNAHVISNAKFIQVKRYNQTQWYPVKILYVADDCDLALLVAQDENFYEDSTQLEIGDIPELNSSLIVVGYPMGGKRVSVTRGIVSRKEQSVYSHTRVDSHLVLQVDAAINPGNSGGPAIQNNKVVGVAFQIAIRGENIGYLIPTNVIKHFLKDIEDGVYNGYTELGIRTQNSFNSILRKAKGIPDNYKGIFVTKTFYGSPAYDILKEGDLIIEIDGREIGKDGVVLFDDKTPLNFVEIIDNKHEGELINLKILREEKKIETEKLKEQDLIFPAQRMPSMDFLRKSYNEKPKIIIVGGLIFQNQSRNLLNSWLRRNHSSKNRSQMIYRFFGFIEDGMNKNDDRDVVFYRKLDHPINAQTDRFLNLTLESFNNIPIKNIEHLEKLLKKNTQAYLKFKFLDVEIPLVMLAEEVKKVKQEIKTIYNIP